MPKRDFNCRYYLPADPDDEFVWRGRVSYLQAIARNPATWVVLQELKRDVLPVFRIASDATGWNPDTLPPINIVEKKKIDVDETAFVNDPPYLTDWWNIERAAGDFYPALIPLKQALHAWAKRFTFIRRGRAMHRSDPMSWFMNCALHTLANWTFSDRASPKSLYRRA